jgi:RNA polymerase sigma factor (sigma-70 family)
VELHLNPEEEKLWADNPEIRRVLSQVARSVAYKKHLPESVIPDLEQVVLVRILRLGVDQLEPIANWNAYLYRVATNEANRLISKGQTEEVQINEDPGGYSDNSDARSRMESAILLREIWERLNLEEQNILKLMITGYTEKEMAVRLEIKYDAARKRVSRLREKLQEFLTSNTVGPTSIREKR